MKPVVGILMGSDSDLPVMQAALDVFSEFDVPVEIAFDQLAAGLAGGLS